MLQGRNTWVFKNKPVILSTATVGGPTEGNGPFKDEFDHLYDNMWLGEDSFEAAQQIMMEDAAQRALDKVKLKTSDINFFISGDLTNQITPTTFAADTLGIPYLGIFSACATMTESLALSALILDQSAADFIISGASSHNAAAERQFRFPTEYGGQKPPTAQFTVTGAGCAVVARRGRGPAVASATIGKVVDYGMTDAFNMGGAMAPAAVETITTHFKNLNIDHTYYDYILTGDLGTIGRSICLDLFKERNIEMPEDKFLDSGVLLFDENQTEILAGGSGPACCAVTTYGHFIRLMNEGKINRILVVATGALHSPLTVNQSNAIPTIAHAVSIELGSDTK